METYRKILLIVLLFIFVFGCSTNKQIIPSYQYFIVDSAYNGGVYSFTIKDPNPRVEYIFPMGITDYPSEYDHYIRIYYKQDSVDWVKNDTLILVKKSPKQK